MFYFSVYLPQGGFSRGKIAAHLKASNRPFSLSHTFSQACHENRSIVFETVSDMCSNTFMKKKKRQLPSHFGIDGSGHCVNGYGQLCVYVCLEKSVLQVKGNDTFLILD